jgi:23S rRNA-/tRNA-specific pseudouridylate synthase
MSSLKYKVIFSNSDLLVVSKPAGISVDFHPGESTHLEAEVQLQYPGFFLCHRIDKQTSGLVLLANRNGSIPPLGKIQSSWHQNTQKTYLAIIRTPSWKKTTVYRDLYNPSKGMQSAITGFKVLQSIGGYSLVACSLLQNGRMHQIRKHLTSITHPIVGDQRYGGEFSFERRGQLLHAWKLNLVFDGVEYHFVAPPPDDFWSFFSSKRIKVDWEKIV